MGKKRGWHWSRSRRAAGIVIPRLQQDDNGASFGKVSKLRTFAGGHRSFDILHVATAVDLDAREFLSFDANQNELATAEGLKAPLVGA